MKKVLVFGTFDKLHSGHLNFFKQAKKYGRLFVIVGRDKTIKKLKGKLPRDKEKKRKREIEKIKLAERVLFGSLKNQYVVIKKIKPDIICLGYDQTFFIKELPKKIQEFGLKTKIIRLKSYKPYLYKSSKIS